LAIPDFEASGILPTGIHDCDLDEIEARYVYNDRRRNIWHPFRFYLRQIAEGIPEVSVAYVDGSFVTDKVEPGDVDLILEFSTVADLANVKARLPHLMNRREIKAAHKVDLLTRFEPNPPGDDFRELFQLLKPEDAIDRGVPAGTKKGILKIAVR
jgi:hypothetical protein